MACQQRCAEGNVVWSRRGVAWALYRWNLPSPDEPSPPGGDHDRALSQLRGEAMVLSLHDSASAQRLRFLAVELVTPGGRPVRSPLLQVVQAAGAEVAGAFGISPAAPGAREAFAHRPESQELTAQLCRDLQLQPVAPEEMDSIWRAGTLGESRQHGFLRRDCGDQLAYETWLIVSTMPEGGEPGMGTSGRSKLVSRGLVPAHPPYGEAI